MQRHVALRTACPLKCKTADLKSTALLYNKGENDELISGKLYICFKHTIYTCILPYKKAFVKRFFILF